MPIVITGAPVETIGLELDPDGSSVDLNDGVLYRLTAIDLPEPPLKSIYAGNFDTEGSFPAAEHGYENREINLTLLVFAADPVSLRALISTLNEKEGKINRESRGNQPGGVLRVTLPDDTPIDFDLLEAKATGPLRHEFFTHSRTEITLTFMAKPFWRGEVDTPDTSSESSLPWWTRLLSAIDCDVSAIAELVVTETGGNDRWGLLWGVQSRYYDPTTTAELAYEAEDLTPKGGAATAVGAIGASGSGSNVVRQGTLTPGWQAMLSTEHAADGHLTHVGSFDVLARAYMPTSNTGAVSVALEWGQGDLRRRTTNDAVEFEADHYREGQFVIVRLGQIHIAEGSEQWEGRIIAKSTVAGDDLDVDWLALVPIGEKSGELSGLLQLDTPTAFSARDEFDQTAGALTGKTLPVGGGNWAGAGDATDFTIDTTNDVAERTAASDSGASPLFGRLAYAPPTLANVLAGVTIEGVGIDSLTASGTLDMCVVARYVDANNWFYAGMRYAASNVSPRRQVIVVAAVGGSGSVIASVEYPFASDARFDLRLLALDTGVWALWANREGSAPGSPVASGYLPDLATGGALASGKPGIYDRWVQAGTFTRRYDNFFAAVPAVDAAIFADQSLKLTHEGATREDAAGTIWSPVSSVRGNYLRLAPGGVEGRQNRIIAIPFQNDPDTMGDPGGPADISVEVTSTRRGISIPS